MTDLFTRKNIEERDSDEILYQYYRTVAIKKMKEYYDVAEDDPKLCEIELELIYGINRADYVNVVDRIFTLFDYKNCQVSNIPVENFGILELEESLRSTFTLFVWISKQSNGLQNLIKTLNKTETRTQNLVETLDKTETH